MEIWWQFHSGSLPLMKRNMNWFKTQQSLLSDVCLSTCLTSVDMYCNVSPYARLSILLLMILIYLIWFEMTRLSWFVLSCTIQPWILREEVSSIIFHLNSLRIHSYSPTYRKGSHSCQFFSFDNLSVLIKGNYRIAYFDGISFPRLRAKSPKP